METLCGKPRRPVFSRRGPKLITLQVILAYGSYLYFDHPYEADPDERGLYWATRKISTYDAWRFHENLIYKDDHLPCPDSVPVKSECHQLNKKDNIIGTSYIHSNIFILIILAHQIRISEILPWDRLSREGCIHWLYWNSRAWSSSDDIVMLK